jgi:hypothetical protein
MYRRILEWSINSELVGIWKEAVVASFKALFYHFPGKLKKTMKEVIKYIRPLVRCKN